MLVKISVIIPFYNRVNWLAEAVESVLLQSYRDYEIILIDDGSTERIDGLINLKDSRMKYHRQLNKGPSSARNKGIELAKGEYIAFLDSDDIYEYNKLQVQLEHMENNPDVIMSHTSYIAIDEKGNKLEFINSGQFSGHVYPVIAMTCPIATPTVMIRSEMINNLRFVESVNIGEDIIFWIQLAKKSEILGIDVPLTRVRRHNNCNTDNIEAHKCLYENVNRYIIAIDKEIPNSLKKKRTAGFYRSIGFKYLSKMDRKSSLQCFFKSILYEPLNLRTFKLLALIVIPRRYYRFVAKSYK